ncbi:MAG: ABC transporter permease [Candidatus Dormibacteraeota bacterium]|uniref:ABC transporter permease n=1 Tax=Candidatus Amunia macphersoniae TaxID=3127014 RepID=A0A934NGI0_9BACT|nr:ABC transporter permease [Candidatus Dormibacteraeota bacterium]
MSRPKNLFWNPIVRREALTRMRSARTMLLLLGFLAILGAVAYAAYGSQVNANTNVFQVSRAGITVFVALAGTVLALITVVVPGLTGGAIAGERERQTLDLLLCTRVHPWRIVVGKLTGSLLFILFLLVAALPVLSVVSLLGGVQLSDILIVIAAGSMTALALGALGILASCVNRRAAGATLSAYVATFLFFAVPPLIGAIGQASHPNGVVTGGASFGYMTSGGGGRALIAGGPAPFPIPGASRILGPSGPPVVDMLSPVVSISGTLSTLQSQANCATFSGFGGPPICTAADQVTDGAFNGWHYWQVGLLFQGILALVCIALSVLVLRGRVPRTRRGERVAG